MKLILFILVVAVVFVSCDVAPYLPVRAIKTPSGKIVYEPMPQDAKIGDSVTNLGHIIK